MSSCVCLQRLVDQIEFHYYEKIRILQGQRLVLDFLAPLCICIKRLVIMNKNLLEATNLALIFCNNK